MTGLSEVGARELTWRYPPAPEQAYELHADGEQFGWLRFDEPAEGDATGELDGRRWTFRHDRGAHPRVTVHKDDSPVPVAEFLPRLTGGGTVSFASGARYCWNRARIWSPQWCFRREGEGSSICVSQQAGALAEGGRVNVCGKAALMPETAVLVLLGWYLRIQNFEHLIAAIPGVG